MPLAGTNGVILGVVIVVALLAVALVLWLVPLGAVRLM